LVARFPVGRLVKSIGKDEVGAERFRITMSLQEPAKPSGGIGEVSTRLAVHTNAFDVQFIGFDKPRNWSIQGGQVHTAA